MPSVTNLAAYQFATLRDLKPLRERLQSHCHASGLKGTILLSTEGVNLFVAGSAESVQALLGTLRALPGLADLPVKISQSDRQPFRRMLVRIKKEIIAFGVEGINPAKRTSPKLTPATLKAWLDEGRPVTLLDTRNDYEVELGTFRNALPIGIDNFREFPAAVAKLPDELKEQPIVMFCTGGIRCEKAGPYMEREGFKTIFQLEGGILKYFEECGGAHYAGECFVFDQRVGVDPQLAETASTQCFACQAPLRAEEQASPLYVVGQSCPHCYRAPGDQQAWNRQARQEAIRCATTPLPGSVAYENRRPLKVPRESDQATLLAFVSRILGHVPERTWIESAAQGRLIGDDGPVGLEHIVRAGERYYHVQQGKLEPAVNADIRVLHEDDALLVIDKPAPLAMHPCGRFNRNTLQFILNQVYHPQKPRPAHRLDANTTGLVIFARTRHFAGLLQQQFAAGQVEKIYLVRVLGHPPEDAFVCAEPIAPEPVVCGARDVAEGGLPARTEFTVRERQADGTTLLEARPLTGRTNQIRVHLWRMGWPIQGERVYLPGQQVGDTQTLAVDDPPLCLHAWRLAFTHPRSQERVAFEAEPPSWA